MASSFASARLWRGMDVGNCLRHADLEGPAAACKAKWRRRAGLVRAQRRTCARRAADHTRCGTEDPVPENKSIACCVWAVPTEGDAASRHSTANGWARRETDNALTRCGVQGRLHGLSEDAQTPPPTHRMHSRTQGRTGPGRTGRDAWTDGPDWTGPDSRARRTDRQDGGTDGRRGRMDGLTDGRAGGRTDGQAAGADRTGPHRPGRERCGPLGQTDGRTDGRTGPDPTDRQTDRTDGRTDERTDGRDAWTA